MSSVKFEERQEQLVSELQPSSRSSQLRESINPSLPKANPYLLQEYKERIEKLEAAQKEAELQRHVHSLPPDQRKLLKQEQEKQKESSAEAAKSSTTPAPDTSEKIVDHSVWAWAKYFWRGEEPEKIVEVGKAGVAKAKEIAGDVLDSAANKVGVTLLTTERVDPDQKRALRDAETALYVEKFRMRKFLEQMTDRMDPFSSKGSQVGEYTGIRVPERYDSRSAQEAMSILATVLAVTSDLAKRTDDKELMANATELANFIQASTRMRKEDFEALDYTTNDVSDLEMAQKWGLIKANSSFVPGMGMVNNRLPEMFFEVQQLLTSYNVLQTLSGVESELDQLLKKVDLDTSSTESDKKLEREKIWREIVSYRITDSIKNGGEQDGVQASVMQHLYGAAILAPLLLAEERGISVGEATTFKLLAEKAKRNVGNDEFLQEQTYRIENAYLTAEREGKIRDLVVSKFGKEASALSNAKLDQALTEARKEFGEDFVKADRLYGDISRHLPAFIELRRALEHLSIEPPKGINTGNREELFKDIRAARREVERVISERLKITPEQAVQMADEFVARNNGSLSEEALQIPQKIKTIAERNFGYHK